jgi:hypothetical protein
MYKCGEKGSTGLWKFLLLIEGEFYEMIVVIVE